MRDLAIHYLSGSTIPSPSADSVHVVRMSHALSEQTQPVTLFGKRGSTESIQGYYGVSEHLDFALTAFGTRLGLLGYLANLSKRAKPDFALGRYAYASAWSALRGVPTIYEVHAPAAGIKQWIEHRIFASKNLLGLVAITQALADYYTDRYPALQGRCLVLPDAANDPGPDIPPRATGQLTIGYVGSWYPGRGIDLIVALASQLPNMRFVVAGGEPRELRTMGLRVPDNMECLGYVRPALVDELLRGTDILLAPYAANVTTGYTQGLDTTRWCSPMKLFEYMAHGKAIVCSNLPVFKEVLTDEENCLLVEPEALPAWLSALTRLDHDRALMQQLGARARTQFVSQHTWSARAAKVLSYASQQIP